MFHYRANDVSLPFQDPLSHGVTYGTQNCAPKIYAAEGTQFCFLLSFSLGCIWNIMVPLTAYARQKNWVALMGAVIFLESVWDVNYWLDN